ncbi:hypothetical protein ES703_56495 [subsurface metagenome]
MSNDEKVCICLTVEGGPGRYIVPGSVEHNCQDCGSAVWVAPSTLAVIDQLTVVCPACGSRRWVTQPGSLEFLSGQDLEIKDYRHRQ